MSRFIATGTKGGCKDYQRAALFYSGSLIWQDFKDVQIGASSGKVYGNRDRGISNPSGQPVNLQPPQHETMASRLHGNASWTK